MSQSLRSRLGAAALPLFAKAVFPQSWLDAGDDRAELQAVAKKRRRFDGPRPDAILNRTWSRTTSLVEGRELHVLTPTSGSTGRLLFHCHGGAFVVGPSAIEWLAVAAVASDIGTDLAIYDYPKVPEHDSGDALPATLAAWARATEDYRIEDIVVSGLSAGGGLAVSLMFQLADLAVPRPAGLALLSPWLDMTVSHPDVRSIATEKLLRLPILRRDGELYAGDRAVTDPLVSPRFAGTPALASLPPIVVTAGAQEVLLPEAAEFVGHVNAAGGDARLFVEAYGQHGGILAPTPESAPIRAALVAACERFLRAGAAAS